MRFHVVYYSLSCDGVEILRLKGEYLFGFGSKPNDPVQTPFGCAALTVRGCLLQMNDL